MFTNSLNSISFGVNMSTNDNISKSERIAGAGFKILIPLDSLNAFFTTCSLISSCVNIISPSNPISKTSSDKY